MESFGKQVSDLITKILIPKSLFFLQDRFFSCKIKMKPFSTKIKKYNVYQP